MEIGTVLLGNDNNNVIVNYLRYLSKVPYNNNNNNITFIQMKEVLQSHMSYRLSTPHQ